MGNTSATRSVAAVAAANGLGMDSGTRDLDHRLNDLVRALYLEPCPNSATMTTQGVYRITF